MTEAAPDSHDSRQEEGEQESETRAERPRSEASEKVVHSEREQKLRKILDTLFEGTPPEEMAVIKEYMNRAEAYELVEELSVHAEAIEDAVENKDQVAINAARKRFQSQMGDRLVMLWRGGEVNTRGEMMRRAERDRMTGELTALELQIQALVRRHDSLTDEKQYHDTIERRPDNSLHPLTDNALETITNIQLEIAKLTVKSKMKSAELMEKFGIEWPIPAEAVANFLEASGKRKGLVDTLGQPGIKEMLLSIPRSELVRIWKESQKEGKRQQDVKAAKDRLEKNASGGAKAEARPPEPEAEVDTEETRKEAEFTTEMATEMGYYLSHGPEGFGGGKGKKKFKETIRNVIDRYGDVGTITFKFIGAVLYAAGEPAESKDFEPKIRMIQDAYLKEIQAAGGDIEKGILRATRKLPKIAKGLPRNMFSNKFMSAAENLSDYATLKFITPR